MTLSRRAEAWLATLSRRPAPSVDEVLAAFLTQGIEPLEVWLDFHDRYAGYVEPIGAELAVWGLLHDRGVWAPNGRIDYEPDTGDGDSFVTCADVHPSYDYRLDQNGVLLAGPAASFDVHVERQALRWWFCAVGRPSCRFNVKKKSEIEEIRSATTLVSEASDAEVEYYVGDRMLAVFEVRRPRWVEVLCR